MPPPGAARSSMLPPSTVTSRFEIASPSPEPGPLARPPEAVERALALDLAETRSLVDDVQLAAVRRDRDGRAVW